MPGAEVIFGQFKSHPVSALLAGAKPHKFVKIVKILKTEEKSSDVSLAMYLLSFRLETPVLDHCQHPLSG
ncbi:MAG: hypothetical protein A4E65_00132 [Syntrophorhabdus sp. PtaU1.Bin153]|nr:MAG: hypothetical protein A4E65_00132 [Syntrophorhabdus sp. PtaU1.Bin153]